MVIELFDQKGKNLAVILSFDRNYCPNPIFSEQIFHHFIFILRPLRKNYLWLVPNFVYVHLFNNRTTPPGLAIGLHSSSHHPVWR